MSPCNRCGQDLEQYGIREAPEEVCSHCGKVQSHPAEGTEKVVSHGCAEGVYRWHFWAVRRPDNGGYWQLLRWRVSCNGVWGRWHRVNTNRTRPVAGFEPVLDP